MAAQSTRDSSDTNVPETCWVQKSLLKTEESVEAKMSGLRGGKSLPKWTDADHGRMGGKKRRKS